MHRIIELAHRAFATMLVCAWLPVASVASSAQPAAAAVLPANCTGKTTVTCTFDYNGTDGSDGSGQTFTVPAKINVLTIDAWGAQGGGGNGGLGGHERATLGVTPGETLQVFVGGRSTGQAGGYNGGGEGSAGGGGASDVRRAPAGLADRLVVAGGGGGEGIHYINDSEVARLAGGAGGAMPGAQSAAGICTTLLGLCGGGGSTTGGAAGLCFDAPTAPSAGTEGVGGAGGSCGSGGGGGYFGGGGGGYSAGPEPLFNTYIAFVGPAGGGSGHVAAGVNQVHEQGVQSGNGLVTITYSTRPVPPMGSVACAVSGTASFSKPLTDAPSAKPVKVTLELAGDDCDSTHVVGGKAPITDVAVKATLFLAPGATCSSAPSAADKPQKVQVKWQGRNATNKLMTVAVTNTTAVPFGYSVFVPLFPLGSPVLTDPKKPFVNDEIFSSLVLTDGLSIQQAMCASPGGLTTVNIVGVIGADS